MRRVLRWGACHGDWRFVDTDASLVIFSGIAVRSTVLAITVRGEALCDVLDSRRRR